MSTRRPAGFISRVWKQALAGAALFGALSGAALSANLLANPGFENNPPPNFGNNIGWSMLPWVTGGGAPPNVVTVDGGVNFNYGAGGPQRDAEGTPAGTRQHYLDITNGDNTVHQSFQVPTCGSADTSPRTVTYSGYFSSRENSTSGSGSIRIVSGTGTGGTVLGQQSITNIGQGNSQTDPWQQLSGTVQVTPGSTISFVVFVSDFTNFDNASLTFDTFACPSTTLALQKRWLSSTAGSVATINATRGGNVIDSLTSTATGTAGQTTTDASPVAVFAGDVITLSELVTGASYSQSLSCSGPVTVAGSTVTVNPGLPATGAAPIVCTYGNVLASTPQVSISKTASTPTLTPGGTITYTVVVNNTGTVPANGTVVNDPVPAGIASMTWTCAGACGAASGSGAINDTIGTLPVGGSATYTVTAQVSATPPAVVTNTASVTPGGGGVCLNGCSSSASVPPVPQLSVSKTASTPTLTPGGTITYTVVVSNAGSVAASGTVVNDPVPAGIDSMTWTCAGACGAASGSGAINDTIGTLPVGGSATYTVTAQVSATPPTVVTNTASVTPGGGGVCVPGNSAAPCTAAASVPPVPQVSVSKTAGSATVLQGGRISYTIVVSNAGAVSANGTAVQDTLPAGLTAASWTCTASGGATCPSASGSGDIAQTIATLPPGGSVTYTVNASVTAAPGTTLTNTASVTPPGGGVCVPGNVAAPCSSAVSSAVVGAAASTPVPTLGEWALVLLSLLLAAVAALRVPRRAPH